MVLQPYNDTTSLQGTTGLACLITSQSDLIAKTPELEMVHTTESSTASFGGRLLGVLARISLVTALFYCFMWEKIA